LSGKDYADLPSAARALAEDFGVMVIVDGSPNSLPSELFTTTRESVITVGPMTWEQKESIPEFMGLMDALKALHLDDPLWKVLGSSPIDYLKLGGKVHFCYC
jgi:hypothetical protein